MTLPWAEWGPSSPTSMVFLHGFLGEGSDWKDIANQLPNYHCLAPDLPGHGECPIDPSVTIHSTVEHLEKECQAKQLHSVIVVGYSMGGRIALQWALRSHRIKGIILESASPGIECDRERRARQIYDNVIENKLRQMHPSDFLDWWCAQPMFGNMIQHPMWPEMKERRSRYNPESAIAALHQLGAVSVPAIWDTLASLPIIGYVTGEYDIKYRGILDRIQTKFPHIPVTLLDGLGHNCHFESASRFATIIDQLGKGSGP